MIKNAAKKKIIIPSSSITELEETTEKKDDCGETTYHNGGVATDNKVSSRETSPSTDNGDGEIHTFDWSP